MQGSRNEKSQEIQLLKERPKPKAISCPRGPQQGRCGGWSGVAGTNGRGPARLPTVSPHSHSSPSRDLQT